MEICVLKLRMPDACFAIMISSKRPPALELSTLAGASSHAAKLGCSYFLFCQDFFLFPSRDELNEKGGAKEGGARVFVSSKDGYYELVTGIGILRDCTWHTECLGGKKEVRTVRYHHFLFYGTSY